MRFTYRAFRKGRSRRQGKRKSRRQSRQSRRLRRQKGGASGAIIPGMNPADIFEKNPGAVLDKTFKEDDPQYEGIENSTNSINEVTELQ